MARLSNIRIDVATAEVLDALKRQGIAAIVLKGAALADWYPEGQPPYADGDIWVAPPDLALAGQVLRSAGFEPQADEAGLPDWWLEHASEWKRERDLSAIDLHRYLQGVGVTPELAWQTLSGEGEQFELAGRPALRLNTPARALYVTLHAIHHGIQHVNALRHLVAALDALDDEDWRRAGALAAQLEATQEFQAGLRLVPAGRELSQRLGFERSSTIRARLKQFSPPSAALTLDAFATADGARRYEILWRKLFPPPNFIEHWWPPAARSRVLLAIGYLYRPLWVISQFPRGVSAYLEARRRARRGRPPGE